jgi:adenosylcobinamide-GDP ribazoletransferase
MIWIKGVLINLQFFTAIPIKMELPMDKQHLQGAVRTFPLLGLIQGIIYASFLYGAINFTPFSPLASAFFLWLVTIFLTGGIHLDGWMDASDAYFSYQDKEKRLEIMKDPRTGAFGVISIIVLLSSRFFFIYELVSSIHIESYILIAALPFLSKNVMGMVLLTVKSAKNEGLGHMFQEASSKKILWIYPLYIVLFLFLTIFFGDAVLMTGILTIAAGGCYVLCQRNALKWFGGITGDVLGASVEGTEIVLWMIVWLLHYFVMA